MSGLRRFYGTGLTQLNNSYLKKIKFMHRMPQNKMMNVYKIDIHGVSRFDFLCGDKKTL